MSAPLNRRAAFGVLASIPALAILPAAAVAPLAPHPDAELFALQPAIDAADRELQAAFDACDLVDGESYFDKVKEQPEQPAAFTPEEQRALDAFTAKLRERRFAPTPEWEAYDQAVLEIKQEAERLKVECGLTAAEEARDAAHETVSQLQADVIDTPATTLAGLIFKARYAEAHDYDEEVMVSIVADLLEMGEAAL